MVTLNPALLRIDIACANNKRLDSQTSSVCQTQKKLRAYTVAVNALVSVRGCTLV